MGNDDKPVTQYTLEVEKGKIYRKIDENHRIQSDKINALEVTINRQVTLQENTYESQKNTERHLEKLNETMSKVGDEVVHIKYKVKSHDDTLQSVSGALSEKQKDNTAIAVGLIAATGGVIGAAISVAPILFQ